ncbi:MAG TPA: ABC transporter permease [Acidobacteriaceae bacterium]|nr:ABC transporter permease [Acidobacteriaceae bacterium]
MPSVRTVSRRSFERTLASAKRTMVLSEIVSLAIDSFQANKVRVMLTSLGMVIGSASLILVVTVALTGKHYILHLIQSIGSNMVEVEYSGGGPGSAGQHDLRNDYLTLEDETAVLEQVPSVAYSSPMLQMHDRISFGNGVVKDISVLGVSPQYRLVRNLILINGRFFDDEDDITHAKVAVVTEPFARARFGSANAVNKSFEIKGIPFTIIGTFKESVDTFGQTEVADQTILIPYSVARYFTGSNYIKALFFSIRDSGDVELAKKQILQVIHTRHQPNSVYDAQTLTELLRTAGDIANALTLVLLLVSSVTLAVGGIGIMNIMLANVRSRIREIGIRKALGATYREIKLQFLIEAVFISLSGGIVGTILGLALPYSVRLFTSYRIPISGLSAIIALAAATIVGVVFGTLPATRAAQLDPVESLKYE